MRTMQDISQDISRVISEDRSTNLRTRMNLRFHSRLKSALAVLVTASMLVTAAPAVANPEDAPSASEMAADLVVARPVGAAITVVGAALFVVSLPFSALGGNTEQAAETLVMGPARETFQRCLGCINAGRYRRVDNDE